MLHQKIVVMEARSEEVINIRISDENDLGWQVIQMNHVGNKIIFLMENVED